VEISARLAAVENAGVGVPPPLEDGDDISTKGKEKKGKERRFI